MTPDRSLIHPTLEYEQNLWKSNLTRIAGIDEAGRGAWAGPVCAAAVILPPDPGMVYTLDKVRDSKLMTARQRELWAGWILDVALAAGVGTVTPEEVAGYYEQHYRGKAAAADSDDMFQSRKETIVADLRRKKLEEAFVDWINQLKEKYTVDLNSQMWAEISSRGQEPSPPPPAPLPEGK